MCPSWHQILATPLLSGVKYYGHVGVDRVTGVRSVTWPSVVLDSSSLILLTVALYTQTVTVIAVDIYWQCYFKVTGEV